MKLLYLIGRAINTLCRYRFIRRHQLHTGNLACIVKNFYFFANLKSMFLLNMRDLRVFCALHGIQIGRVPMSKHNKISLI